MVKTVAKLSPISETKNPSATGSLRLCTPELGVSPQYCLTLEGLRTW